MQNNLFNRILWGLLLILAAAAIIVDQMHLWTFHLGVWAIIDTVFFITTAVYGLIRRHIFNTVFSLAFLLMIYLRPLHLMRLHPAIILLAALLISLGLSLIFKRNVMSYSTKKIYKKNINYKKKKTNTIHESDGSVYIRERFSQATCYVDSHDLTKVNIDSNMANLNVYLDNAKSAGDEITINLDITMSNINIYIPLSWKIQNNSAQSLSGLTIRGKSNGGGPIVRLEGYTNMSSININYI